MAQFMLLLHETPMDFSKIPPEEIQRIIEKYTAWNRALAEKGTLVSGEKLKDEGGRILTSRNGQITVVDGPFSEAKEVIAGFYLIKAADYKEAVEMSKGCPHLEFGGRIELREIDPV